MTSDGFKHLRRLISPPGDLVNFCLHRRRGVLLRRRSLPPVSGRCHFALPGLRPSEQPVLASAPVPAQKLSPGEPLPEQRVERSEQDGNPVVAAVRGAAKPRIATARV